MARTKQSRVPAALIFFAVALAHAQDAPPAAEQAAGPQEPTDEVIVRGERSVFRLRIELQAAREHVWDIFNQINSNDEFDISCADATRTGTRIRKRVCRPNYADRATSRAGKDLTRRMQRRCDPTSETFGPCLERVLQSSGAEAQAEIGRIAGMDRQMDEEFQRLARSNPELAAAILNYQQKQREYEDVVRNRKGVRKD